jgi:hypothetical protein
VFSTSRPAALPRAAHPLSPQEEAAVSLSAPKQWTFLAGVICWVLGLIGMLAMPGAMPILGFGAGVWLGMLGGLILILGCVLEGF